MAENYKNGLEISNRGQADRGPEGARSYSPEAQGTGAASPGAGGTDPETWRGP